MTIVLSAMGAVLVRRDQDCAHLTVLAYQTML